jgi:hypothetical protein
MKRRMRFEKRLIFFLIEPNKVIPILHLTKRDFINGGSLHCRWLKPTAMEGIIQTPFVLFQLAP